MSRKIFISDDMASDERIIEVAETDPEAAILWPWILLAFNDWGRSTASPVRLKAKLFPMHPIGRDRIAEVLEVYADVGLIVLYEVEDKRYMAVPDPERWWRWQTHIRKEKRTDDSGSDVPRPPVDNSRVTPRADVTSAAIECEVCQQVFHPSRSDARTCSDRCRKRLSRMRDEAQVNEGAREDARESAEPRAPDSGHSTDCASPSLSPSPSEAEPTGFVDDTSYVEPDPPPRDPDVNHEDPDPDAPDDPDRERAVDLLRRHGQSDEAIDVLLDEFGAPEILAKYADAEAG